MGADIFDSLFGAFGGGGARAGGARAGASMLRGDDIEISVTLPFVDAAKGAQRTVRIQPIVDCNTCKGSGLKQGAKKSSCAVCAGSGTRTFTIQSGFTMASTCQACGGSGEVVPEGSHCRSCEGHGKVREAKTVEVKVPPGVDDGMKLRIDGKGDAPIEGKGRNGDLYVRINVLPSKQFRRQASNLYHDISVPFYTAILGGRARVPTLDNEVEIRVPNGTQPGEEMVLKGKGVKKLYRDETGDLVVRFNVTMPRSLTSTQRQILETFIAETDFPGSTSFGKPNPSTGGGGGSGEGAAAAAAETSAAEDDPSSTSPGLFQQAKPPPSERKDSPKWWQDMSDDSLETPKRKRADKKAKAPEAKPEAKQDATGEKHSFLGDLWKGLRSRF